MKPGDMIVANLKGGQTLKNVPLKNIGLAFPVVPAAGIIPIHFILNMDQLILALKNLEPELRLRISDIVRIQARKDMNEQDKDDEAKKKS